MDKLKPILAQKFWILLSVVLIMPLVGYFMTKGKLAAEIDDRWKKLDSTFTGIPSGSGVPNDSWTNKLNELNASQKLHNVRANQELWLKQKERMSWPKDVAPYMASAEYFKDLNAQQKGDQVLFKYPRSYESQIRALWEIVDPLDDGVNLRDSNKRRKVAFAMADLHQSQRMYLGDIERSFAEIWGAQEDIWLQTELLQAIRRLNANAISQGDASVKQLGKIQLFGGTKSTGDAAGSTTGGATGGAGNEMAMMMPSGFGGTGARSESTTALSAEINLAEEFDVSKESGGGSGNPSAAMAAAFSGAGGASDAGATGTAKSDIKRYLDLDEKQPYKRRAFYIKVIMDHQKVPDLIAELMNSPFPVEIVRVQQVWLSDTGGSGTGGGPQGMMTGAGPSNFPSFNPTARGDGTDAFTAPTATNFEADGAAGASATGIAGATSRTGTNNPGSAAALADPNLAQVAILGVWTLYLPPPPAADAGQTAPPVNSSAPPTGLAATPENATPPADPAADTVAAEGKPTTTEASDGTGDEPKKSDNPEAPKSETAKPEKTESDPDKPEAEKTPPKAEAADKSDSETK